MGIGAERYRARRDDRGMPYWQQLLLAQAAGPVVKEVVGFAGEGAKQLFLGRHSKGLLEGQMGSDLESLTRLNKDITGEWKKYGDIMRGGERTVYDGVRKHNISSFEKGFVRKYGPLTYGNNAFHYKQLLDTKLPDIEKSTREEVAAYEKFLEPFDDTAHTPSELKRRIEEDKLWHGKTFGGKVLTRGLNFLRGIDTEDVRNESTKRIILGDDYINFKDDKALKHILDSSESGLIPTALKNLRSNNLVEHTSGMDAVMEAALNDPVLSGKVNSRYFEKQKNNNIASRTINTILEEAQKDNIALFEWVSTQDKEKLAAQYGLSFTSKMSTERKTVVATNSLMSDFYESKIPRVTELTANVNKVISAEAYNELMKIVNNAASNYTSGKVYGINPREVSDPALPIPDLIEASLKPGGTQYVTELKRVTGEGTDIMKNIASNYSEDFSRALNELINENIPIPDDFTANNLSTEIYTVYVNKMATENVGSMEDDTRLFRTINIKDPNYGTELIKNIFKNHDGGEHLSSLSPAEIKKVDNIVGSIDAENKAKIKTPEEITDGWSITDDGKKNLSEKLDIKSTNELLGGSPTIENLNEFTRDMADAAHILKEEAGHKNLNYSTYLYMQGVRESFAEKYKIPLDENDTFLKKIISGESDAEGGTLGDSEPNIEVSIVKDENVTEVPSSLSESKGIIEEEHPAKVRRRWVADKFKAAQEVTKSRQVHMKGWLNLSKEERVTTYEGKIENYIRAMEAESKQPSLLSRAS